LEQQLSNTRDLENGGGGDDMDDFDDFDNDRSGGPSDSFVMRKRSSVNSGIGISGNTSNTGSTARTLRVLNDLERMGVRPGVGVRHAVSVIDAWTLFTGR
jgi:hypothetical protein